VFLLAFAARKEQQRGNKKSWRQLLGFTSSPTRA
jgi:hypothetical protein